MGYLDMHDFAKLAQKCLVQVHPRKKESAAASAAEEGKRYLDLVLEEPMRQPTNIYHSPWLRHKRFLVFLGQGDGCCRCDSLYSYVI
jgi:hypothetical protein